MAEGNDYGSFQGSLEKSHDLFSDESVNCTVEEADISMFITPNNINPVDSSDNDDVFLSELLGDMAANSPGNDGGEEGACGGAPTGAQTAETDLKKAGLDEFDDDINDSLLIRCTEEFNGIVPETSSEGSDAEGDIPSLMTRVLKNLGTVPGASKPPIRPPKKGYNAKSSKKIKSVCRPQMIPDSDDENQENDPKLAKNTRFHRASDQEIAQLQMDAKARRTHQQTRWGVNILKG